MTDHSQLDEIYPSAFIRGTRITRMGGKDLGRFQLNSDAACGLSGDNMGVFVGGFRSFNQIVDRLRSLDAVAEGGRWIIVLSSKACAATLYRRWLENPTMRCMDPSETLGIWTSNKATFCVPESLSTLIESQHMQHEPIAGIVLVDSQCRVHRARGFHHGNFRVRHDRPQLLVNFRAGLSQQAKVSPPLLIFSQKPAKSVATLAVQRAYCLDAFLFVDGSTLRCGEVPINGAGQMQSMNRGVESNRNPIAVSA